MSDRAVLLAATPVLLVRNVSASARFYRERFGFTTDFLFGEPPFYGSVSRDGTRLHLRFVGQPNFAELATREESLILATIEVRSVQALFDEFSARAVEFAQGLIEQTWGGIDFHVRDPDGNVISFVEYVGRPRS